MAFRSGSELGSELPETVAAIVAAHRAGSATPAKTVARSYRRIRDHNDPAIFIALRDEKDAVAEAEALAKKDAGALPLYGVPVAVKDNIDVAGLATTAACPAFSYVPARDATAGGGACLRWHRLGQGGVLQPTLACPPLRPGHAAAPPRKAALPWQVQR